MNRPLFPICAAVLVSISPVIADPLSDADREQALERLEKLKKAAADRSNSRFRSAISAFNEGMSSDTAAMELYMNCVEKVEFEDEKKKSSEFRDWKRERGDELSQAGMRLALRHQLRWLVLTLKAASNDVPRQDLRAEAQSIVDAIVNDAKALKDHQRILAQSVTGTVFAKYFSLEDVRAADWPLAPVKALNSRQDRPWRGGGADRQLQRQAEQEANNEVPTADFNFDSTGQLGDIYEQVLLPPYRSVLALDKLRATWNKRIQQEDTIYKYWGGDNSGGRVGTVDSMATPIYQKFQEEGLPALKWQMEVDLYRNGDEAGATVRMLSHLEKYMALPAAEGWSRQLQGLLSKGSAPTTSDS